MSVLNVFASRQSRALAAACVAAVGWGSSVVAGPIPVPNASFESPTTTYVSINVDSWQKAPKPFWYNETGGFLWTQLIGGFKNTPEGAADHLDNCEGDQALWLFAVPEVALYQDNMTIDWNDAAPTHDFSVKYEPGKFYSLTVGINGGGGGMIEGVALEISLYYRTDTGEKITVASTAVVNSLTTFPNHTHLTDFRVHVPVVQPNDPWAGKPIGIRFLSLATDENQGGYWDLDNVRLASGPEPLICTPAGTDARIAWASLRGYSYQLQVSGDLQTWVNYGAAQEGTDDELSKLFPIAGNPESFFRALITPITASPAAPPFALATKKHAARAKKARLHRK